MRVVFHAGFHKTGTSSLQAALRAHAPALRDLMHVATRSGSPAFTAAAEAARALSIDPSAPAREVLCQRLEAWTAALPDLGGRWLVASSEDFAGHMPGRFGLPDYRAAGQVMPLVVAALERAFPGAEVRLLYTVRAAEPWLRSLHWQLAKHPELRLKARRFCKDYAAAADFAAVLDPLEAALAGRAAVIRVPLEEVAARRLGPVEAVYDLIDLPEVRRAALPVIPMANVAPPIGLADQFVTLNRAGLSPEALEQSKADLALLMRAFPAGDA